MTPALQVGQQIEFRTRIDEGLAAKITRTGTVEALSESGRCALIGGRWYWIGDMLEIRPLKNFPVSENNSCASGISGQGRHVTKHSQ